MKKIAIPQKLKFITRRLGQCPTCGSYTSFACVGEQHISVDVAKVLMCPENILLWQCNHCMTTLLEPSLEEGA